MRDAKHLEMWIDIFPLDSVPNKITWAYHFHAWLIGKFKALGYIKVKINNYCSFKQKLIKKVLFLLPLKTIMYWDSKLLRKYENKNTLYYVDWASGYGAIKARMPKAWFEPCVKLLYNGKYYTAPKEWDKVLTQLYGDYMTLPPIEERKGHNVLDIQV